MQLLLLSCELLFPHPNHSHMAHRCLADLVLDLPPSYDLTPLSAERDAVRKQQPQPAAAVASSPSSDHSSNDGDESKSGSNGNKAHGSVKVEQKVDVNVAASAAAAVAGQERVRDLVR